MYEQPHTHRHHLHYDETMERLPCGEERRVRMDWSCCICGLTSRSSAFPLAPPPPIEFGSPLILLDTRARPWWWPFGTKASA